MTTYFLKNYTNYKKEAQKNIEKAVICLNDISSKECSEEANKKIDEALAYCYVVKDNINEVSK